LIEDLERSAFAQLYYPSCTGVRSELAIPVLSGDEVLGVVNFESVQAGVFPEDSVRAVSYLASLTAIAARLARHSVRASQFAQVHSHLLELWGRAARDRDGAREALRELAGLTAEALQADKCDIWRFDRHRSAFSTGGASYPSFSDAEGPRAAGWSAYVRLERRVVWIRRTASGAFESAEFWDGERMAWGAVPAEGWPQTTNERCPPNVCGELGVPIMFRGQGIGVAWIKFESAKRHVLEAEAVQKALAWAPQVGMVLAALEHDHERAERRHLTRSSRDFRDNLLPVGRQPVKHLDVFVLARPHPMSDIGGDFHVVRALDDDTTAFAIGDSQGHGEAAALGMIPLLTTFLSAVEHSRSTKFLLERLLRVAVDMGIRGTALTFVISRLEGRHWLFASSAGHAALLVARPTGSYYNLYSCPSGSLSGLMLGLQANAALGEDRLELFPGDIVIACTDGITEAASDTPAGADFNHGRMQEVLLRLAGQGPLSAETVALSIEREARQHARGAFSDDTTLLVVRVPDA
jgi:serine phosphatase RsbU (regulator of sigma subunit)/GAF domain-containing protein